jgi:hypothetical protein
VPYEKLPETYNQYEFVACLPAGWEPSGRTPWEGWLAGCKQITNDRVGSMQMGLDPEKRKETVEKLKTGPYRFWNQIEEVM